MTARMLIGGEYRILGMGKVTVATPSTVNLVFPTTTDLKLVTGPTFQGLDRVVLVCSAQTAGTTSTLTFSVQDADDAAGSFGTPATAITETIAAGTTGDQRRVIGVQLQVLVGVPRPWIRVRATHAIATDSFVCTVVALAVPSAI